MKYDAGFHVWTQNSQRQVEITRKTAESKKFQKKFKLHIKGQEPVPKNDKKFNVSK